MSKSHKTQSPPSHPPTPSLVPPSKVRIVKSNGGAAPVPTCASGSPRHSVERTAAAAAQILSSLSSTGRGEAPGDSDSVGRGDEKGVEKGLAVSRGEAMVESVKSVRRLSAAGPEGGVRRALHPFYYL